VLDAAKLPVCSKAADFATEDGTLKCTPCNDVLKDQSGRGFFPSFTENDALVKKVYMTFEDTNGNKTIDGTKSPPRRHAGHHGQAREDGLNCCGSPPAWSPRPRLARRGWRGLRHLA
jgi:hypothetical protein